MRIIRSVPAMQRQAKAWRRTGTGVGFVPTMGYLHAGHISLVHRARKLVGPAGQIVVSIYVNPTQFGPAEDLTKYPRDLPQDAKRCREAGVDVLFVPEDHEVYPNPPAEPFSTFVVEQMCSRPMEGTSRPTHFRGVATIVAKLFNLVLPDVAVFGSKDFQQAAVIRRMARDLNFPVKLVVAPTVRERDGLAMSSRNKYLSAEERGQALVLHQALTRTARRVKSARGGIAADRLKREVAELVRSRPAARLDYVEFFEPDSLQPVAKVVRGTQMALAVFVGRTRLIDNGRMG